MTAATYCAPEHLRDGRPIEIRAQRPDDEAGMLDAAHSGWPFAELCTLLCEEIGDTEAPAQAAALLRGWISSGLIIYAA